MILGFMPPLPYYSGGHGHAGVQRNLVKKINSILPKNSEKVRPKRNQPARKAT